MNYPEQRHLFTINEFAKSCGISRTTLIRMEESGFFTPFKIDPDTGYRYFDAQNAAEVGQYQLYQTLGLSREEIVDYYYQRKDITGFLKEKKEKLYRMQRVLEELEIRNNNSDWVVFSYLDMPETVCYCVTSDATTPSDSEVLFYSAHEQSLMAGYIMAGTESIFGLSSDNFRIESFTSREAHNVTACIPIQPPKKVSDPHITTFPATKAFSGLAYGDYTVIPRLCKAFWDEIEKRGIEPAGQARFIGLVAPYVSKHIEKDRFCYRLIVPITERV
ncbi:MAG: hypothetical protein IJL07_07820 [Lachnospiraceae bacterium]|nr:hypothetical protein [Lachnospiraceae bacterium]